MCMHSAKMHQVTAPVSGCVRAATMSFAFANLRGSMQGPKLSFRRLVLARTAGRITLRANSRLFCVKCQMGYNNPLRVLERGSAWRTGTVVARIARTIPRQVKLLQRIVVRNEGC